MINIRAGGGIVRDINLIYLPLGGLCYAVNWQNKYKGVYKAMPYKEMDEKGKEKIIYWYMQVDKEIFRFEDMPIKSLPYEQKITQSDIDEWLRPDRIHPEIDEIYRDIKSILLCCYDFINERDADISTLFILQSWFIELFNGVFYVNIVSRMGGGKTLLLEIFKELCRAGILANDMSYAAIPRMTDRYKCTVLFDEIDALPIQSRDEVFKMLRVGYKPGSKYIRLKPKTFEEECFDVYSAKAYNYRSDVVDDLKNRSITINTNKSTDKRLPFISLYKSNYLAPIYKKMWMFFMDFSNQVNEVNRVIEHIVNKDIDSICSDKRSHIYSEVAQYLLTLFTLSNKVQFNEVNGKQMEEKLERLFVRINGRNIELFTIILNSCAIMGLDTWEQFQAIFEEKEEFESHDEADTKAILRDLLVNAHQKGILEVHKTSCQKFMPYRMLSTIFNKRVYEDYGYKPSQNELKKQLRELGFVDRINRKLLKIGNTPVLCLIYDHAVMKNLGLEDWDGQERRKESKSVAEERRKSVTI